MPAMMPQNVRMLRARPHTARIRVVLRHIDHIHRDSSDSRACALVESAIFTRFRTQSPNFAL